MLYPFCPLKNQSQTNGTERKKKKVCSWHLQFSTSGIHYWVYLILHPFKTPTRSCCSLLASLAADQLSSPPPFRPDILITPFAICIIILTSSWFKYPVLAAATAQLPSCTLCSPWAFLSQETRKIQNLWMGICASSEQLEHVHETDESIVYVKDEQGRGDREMKSGARKVASLFSQRGKKGPNQDSVILCQVPSSVLYSLSLNLCFLFDVLSSDQSAQFLLLMRLLRPNVLFCTQKGSD